MNKFTTFLLTTIKQIPSAWDSLINNLAAMFKTFAFAIIFTLAPLIAPLAPAMLFGYNFYQALPESEFRIIPAIAAAVALESAGFIASKVAIYFYSRRDEGKMWIAITVCTLYLLVGISSVFLETSTPEIKFLTIVVFLTTGLIYIAIALWEDHAESERKEMLMNRQDNLIVLKEKKNEIDEEAKDREHKRQLELIRQSDRHQLKLARMSATLPRKVSISEGKVPVPELSTTPVQAKDWRKLSAEEKEKLSGMSADEIAEVFGVTQKTGRNWKTRLA